MSWHDLQHEYRDCPPDPLPTMLSNTVDVFAEELANRRARHADPDVTGEQTVKADGSPWDNAVARSLINVTSVCLANANVMAEDMAKAELDIERLGARMNEYEEGMQRCNAQFEAAVATAVLPLMKYIKELQEAVEKLHQDVCLVQGKPYLAVATKLKVELHKDDNPDV